MTFPINPTSLLSLCCLALIGLAADAFAASPRFVQDRFAIGFWVDPPLAWALARTRLDRLDTEFKFWFTSSSATPGLSKRRKAHMEAVENLVDTLIAESGGLMKAEFIPVGHFDVL